MFENLRRAFKEAKDNFHREVGRSEAPEQVDALLKGMEREAIEAKAYTEGLKKQLARTQARAAVEQKEVDTCLRRQSLAEQIGDQKTAEIAAAYVAKHSERLKVLQQKAGALEAEVALRESEFGDMLKQIRKARTSRTAFEARARSSTLRDTGNARSASFDDFDRMAEKIDREAARGRIDRQFSDPAGDFDAALGESLQEEHDESVDARLQELKRRMKKR